MSRPPSGIDYSMVLSDLRSSWRLSPAGISVAPCLWYACISISQLSYHMLTGCRRSGGQDRSKHVVFQHPRNLCRGLRSWGKKPQRRRLLGIERQSLQAEPAQCPGQDGRRPQTTILCADLLCTSAAASRKTCQRSRRHIRLVSGRSGSKHSSSKLRKRRHRAQLGYACEPHREMYLAHNRHRNRFDLFEKRRYASLDPASPLSSFDQFHDLASHHCKMRA
jgi:hypothetical protein